MVPGQGTDLASDVSTDGGQGDPGARGLGRGIRWAIHITVVVGILVGLHYLNDWLGIHSKLAGHEYPDWLRHTGCHCFVISYVLCWLGWWLWTLLVTERNSPSFPISRRPGTRPVKLWSGTGSICRGAAVPCPGPYRSGNGAAVPGIEASVDSKGRAGAGRPLDVYASPEGVFITCEGASLLGARAHFSSVPTGRRHGAPGGAVLTRTIRSTRRTPRSTPAVPCPS